MPQSPSRAGVGSQCRAVPQHLRRAKNENVVGTIPQRSTGLTAPALTMDDQMGLWGSLSYSCSDYSSKYGIGYIGKKMNCEYLFI